MLVRLHLPSSSSSPPPPAPFHYRPPAAHCGVADHRPRLLLPPHTTVLIRLTGFDLGPAPCPPAPGPGCRESAAFDGGGNGECGGGGGMEEIDGYWGP